MRTFRIEPVAQTELEAAATWYENAREGLGLEFLGEVERVLARIELEETFATTPIAAVSGGVVRRAFVERFPYIVVFVETDDLRKVIMIRRGNSSPQRRRSRL